MAETWPDLPTRVIIILAKLGAAGATQNFLLLLCNFISSSSCKWRSICFFQQLLYIISLWSWFQRSSTANFGLASGISLAYYMFVQNQGHLLHGCQGQKDQARRHQLGIQFQICIVFWGWNCQKRSRLTASWTVQLISTVPLNIRHEFNNWYIRRQEAWVKVGEEAAGCNPRLRSGYNIVFPRGHGLLLDSDCTILHIP